VAAIRIRIDAMEAKLRREDPDLEDLEAWFAMTAQTR